MPNHIEGQGLVNEWPRIMKEEFLISELISKLNIPTLNFNTCKVKTDNCIFDTFCSRSFHSFVKDDNYITDCKNAVSCQFSKYKNLSIFGPKNYDNYDASKWFDLFVPLINDFKLLHSNNLHFRYETYNCVIVAKNSSWHSGGKLPFEIRLFMFDFASKFYSYDESKFYSYEESKSITKVALKI